MTTNKLPVNTLLERFENRFVLVTESGCWIWTEGTITAGYGAMWDGEKVKYAHRLAVELYRGENIDGKTVCHHCDIPSCVNPNHLFVGTVKDNVRDMHKKKRARGMFGKGEASIRAKLTDDDVRAIRKSPKTHRLLAGEFNIDPSVITMIKNRKAWTHVK